MSEWSIEHAWKSTLSARADAEQILPTHFPINNFRYNDLLLEKREQLGGRNRPQWSNDLVDEIGRLLSRPLEQFGPTDGYLKRAEHEPIGCNRIGQGEWLAVQQCSGLRSSRLITRALHGPPETVLFLRDVAVVIFLTSGARRTVEGATAARLDGPFFVVMKHDRAMGRADTLLTLLSSDVLGAEIVLDGKKVDYVKGAGLPSTER